MRISIWLIYIDDFQNNQRLIELRENEHVYLTNIAKYKEKCSKDFIYVSTNDILHFKENDVIYLDYKIELAVERVGKCHFTQYSSQHSISSTAPNIFLWGEASSKTHNLYLIDNINYIICKPCYKLSWYLQSSFLRKKDWLLIYHYWYFELVMIQYFYTI